MNGIPLKFGEKSDEKKFFIDGNLVYCNNRHNFMKTAFVGIQNEQVVKSICNYSGP